jgi:glucose/arabinose dehydrogenase
MHFFGLLARAKPVRRSIALVVLPLMSSAIALPAYGAEQKEVGITPVAVGAGPFTYDTAEQHDIRVDVLARGLSHGYAIAFLPNKDALVVERGARLRLLRNATGAKPELVAAPIAGVPNFSTQANIQPDDVLGIQDVALHPDFASNGLVYYTYNKPVGYDAAAKRLTMATVLARATLRNMRMVNAQDLLVGETVIGAGGSRILFGRDGMLFVTVGALSTGDLDSAQRTDNIYGKVLRIRTDGTIPADNPFASVKGARREIYTYGHRDPLGLAFDPQGRIIASEHGPLGGDEINHIQRGGNYGWPKFT